ncbi:Urease operon accessory protein [Rhizobium sp. NRK18]|uniref:Urease operon accessory protein n=1 Tax=Rhizobium sp. NRK18 TaxID=2964667 RepID=UPI0021C3A575|nr:Urease operon accessory protein [Rhizobium sp. NRK18]MCQ2003434.1 Urease operon accessory protein [Rhizobium sp. NRK18]
MVRRIAIVGNGPVPQDAAARVDGCDFVIRFNDCRSLTSERGRTDVVAVCNTGRPGKQMLYESDWRDIAAVRAAASIWCVRDPLKFDEMRAVLGESHPDLDDFCDDYTDGFAAFAAESGKGFRVIDRQVHERLDADLAAVGAGAYVVPSSGMVAIAEVLTHHAGPEDTILLAGFGHQGWDGHPFAAEKVLVDRYAAEGRLIRISDISVISPLEGV